MEKKGLKNTRSIWAKIKIFKGLSDGKLKNFEGWDQTLKKLKDTTFKFNKVQTRIATAVRTIETALLTEWKARQFMNSLTVVRAASRVTHERYSPLFVSVPEILLSYHIRHEQRTAQLRFKLRLRFHFRFRSHIQAAGHGIAQQHVIGTGSQQWSLCALTMVP